MSYTLVTSDTVYPASVSYQLITLTANITLYWPSSGLGSPIAAGFNDVNPDQAGRVITLPDALLGSPGSDIIFNNISAHSFLVHTSDGALINTVTPGQIKDFKLTDNSTAAGTWLVIPFGGGVDAITAFTIKSSDASLIVTNGAVTPPGSDNISLSLSASLKNLNNVTATGLAVITGNGPLTWGTATVTAGSNITITNGDGILGNPTVALTGTVAGLTSLQVGSFTTTGGIMSATATNTDLKFSTTGTGKLDLNGLTITSAGVVSGSFNNAYIPKAWCVFSDGTFGDSNSLTIQDSANVFSIEGSAGYYQINFATDMANINYGVTVSVGSAGTATGTTTPPTVYNGFYTTRTKAHVVISVVDAAGELVSSLPNGVTVVIMSSS
jgi:hypothetical protein